MTNTTPVTIAINVGSSSLKCAAFSFDVAPVALERTSFPGDISSTLPALLAWMNDRRARLDIAGVGHRVVHGGPAHSDPTHVTNDVLADLHRLIPLAPNHLPPELAVIDAVRHHLASVPHVVCFDTAFHQSMPEVARRLPIPVAYDLQGIRRYGFHGLSYAYLLEELRRIAGADVANGRIVLAHLGNGSSLAAVRDGRSIDTTMGFTPTGGVVMSTRSGDIDPGVISYLARHEGLSPERIEDLLSHHAGLLAISEDTGDLRTLLDRERSDDRARLAVAMYTYSIRKAVGAFAAALEGLETLVFSGGIGEHAPEIRTNICDGLAFLGLHLDAQLNQANAPLVSSRESRVTVRVIPTDEELMIARATYRVIAAE